MSFWDWRVLKRKAPFGEEESYIYTIHESYLDNDYNLLGIDCDEASVSIDNFMIDMTDKEALDELVHMLHDISDVIEKLPIIEEDEVIECPHCATFIYIGKEKRDPICPTCETDLAKN